MRRSSSPSRECPFCQVIAGESAADLVLREDGILAILDHRPLVEGHCLVCPTDHVETMLELPDGRVGPLFVAVRRVASAMRDALGAHGALVLVNNRVSQSVPHLHIHVVPRRFKDGLFARPFFWARRRYPASERSAEIAGKLREALASPGSNRHPDSEPDPD